VNTGGAAFLATALTAVLGWPAALQAAPAPPAPAHARSCAPPDYPLEARRYELEGITTLRYRLAPDGSVKDVEVAASSGWKLLDDATIRTIQSCAFTPQQAARAKGAPQSLKYVWDLDGDRVRPHLLPGSCPANAYFKDFLPYVDTPSDAAGIKVRLLVDTLGKPRGVKTEGGQLSPQLADALVKYVESCRFGFNPAIKGERTDTVYGRVVLGR
jgi:TonB family protein